MNNLNADSRTLSPLPPVLQHGLIAVSTVAYLSFFSSSILFVWLTYRLISWRKRTGSKAPTNQFLLLVYNLLFADIQQGLAFVLNSHHLNVDAIDVGSSTCWAQGWFVSTGDLASSLFVLAIGTHTFFAVILDKKPPQWALWTGIFGLWTFNYTMAIIPIALHRDDLYVRAGAWCWINSSYQNDRLWFHYFWIFLCMFLTFLIYVTIYVVLTLRYSTSRSTSGTINSATSSSLPSAQPPHALPLMILYPMIYIICTTPLAAGRLASMANEHVSLSYFCVAGAMISCNGWLDVILYIYTRRGIVFGEPCSEAVDLSTFIFGGKTLGLGTTTTIEGGRHTDPNNKKGDSSNSNSEGSEWRGRIGIGRRGVSTSSTENFFNSRENEHVVGIKTETTVEVSVARSLEEQEAYELEERPATATPTQRHGARTVSRSRSRGQQLGTNVRVDKASWETKSGGSYDEL